MKIQILIADDHEIIRRGVREILAEEYPCAFIDEAENGEILAGKALSRKWDVIISDITMPVMNGLDALRYIKKQWPDMAVLMMSISAEEHFAFQIFKAGASGYLSKDMLPAKLVNAVQQLLAGRKYFPHFTGDVTFH